MTEPLDRSADPPGTTPARTRLVLGVQLVAAGLLYTVGAARSGWANAYYAAAAQAGASSWHAFLFGALDPAGGITVDKPPAALWLMALSVRLFGLSHQAVLWPQAACAVATAALVFSTVRRQVGPGPGLIASGLFVVTPVVTLLARYDNPDTLMTLVLTGAAYGVTRAVDRPRGGTGWVVLAGALVGLGFLTKQVQGLLTLPALGLTVLVATPGSLWTRIGRVAAGAAGAAVTAGWWLVMVQLTPAARRPFIGGTVGNSIWELTVGYNGLGRLTGSTTSAGSGATNGTHAANYGRLLGSGGNEAGWLLPAAVVLVVAAWRLTRRSPRRDPVRSAVLLWGGWLAVVGLVLSSLRGISHSYYTIQLAPAIAAGVAVGGSVVWGRRHDTAWAKPLLTAVVTASALWSCALLVIDPGWPIAAIPVVVLAAAVWTVAHVELRFGAPLLRRVAAGAALVALATGPTAWSLATAGSVHQGANLEAGPGATSLSTPGGIVPGTHIPVSVADLVRDGAGGYDWSAGVVGRDAAQLQLTSGASVRMVGGFAGSDPDPTLAQFQGLVADGRMHYLVVQASTLSAHDGTTAGQIVHWATGRFTDVQEQGWLVFDLTSIPRTGAG